MTLEKELTPETYFFVRDVRLLSYFSFGVLAYPFGHITETIYISINKRQFNPYNFVALWDFLIFLVFFGFIYFNYQFAFMDTWKERSFLGQENRSNIFMRTMAMHGKAYLGLEVFFMIAMVFILWIRAIYLLRYNSYLGKLTGVV